MPNFNNLIQEGVPKMMRVTDDLHRMVDYIRDLRNMMIGLALLTIIGILIFLVLKRRNRKQRRSNGGHNRVIHSSNEHSPLSHPYMDEHLKVDNSPAFISKVS
uniref:Uncharacterized protein n=1 Tax=Panagrolaimus davidi TaxID=227884 RepID=A0A914Q169_9BILA